jgi:hypothetical protein
MKTLWIAHCEIRFRPGYLQSGLTLGFSNVVTWGETRPEVQEKIRNYLSSFKWELLDCEKIDPVRDGGDYGEELNDLIDQGTENPNAILLGRIFTYKAT